MCRSCGRRHNSVVTATSPSAALNDGSLDSASSGFTAGGWRGGGGGGSGVSSSGGGGGQMPGVGGLMVGESDVRSSGLTMKEYDQLLTRLNKENFALKLRVYFLEEKQGLSAQGAPALNKANIELKVENESLKRQLYEKQQLLSQASSAITQLEEDYKQQLQQLVQEKQRAVQHLQDNVAALQQSVSEHSARCEELEAALQSRSAPAISELTQLCDLAFPDAPCDAAGTWGPCDVAAASASDSSGSGITVNTSNVAHNTISNTLPATTNTLQQLQHQQGYTEHHHYHHHRNTTTTSKDNCTADLLGLDTSLTPSRQQQPGAGASNGVMATRLPPLALQGVFSLSGGDGSKSAVADTAQLQQQIDVLQTRVQQLQHELHQRDRTAAALQQDLDNLKRELALKEGEASERQQRVEAMREELTEQMKLISDKDAVISNLHRDLNRVEPEISIKVQEIEERDRIIEEKIGQIEQQNKILVEIQITLDEKQKQIAELEASLSELRERVQQLQADYDKSCISITGFMADVASRDKEIVALKRDMKKKDRKIKDLVAELKETLDMLGKAKWEAETAGRGEDSVKEMVEEEHERLWAEMEQKKQQLVALSAELKRAEDSLREQSEDLSAVRQALQLKGEAELQCQADIEALKHQLTQREQLEEDNKKQISALEDELDNVRHALMSKQQQLKHAQKNTDAASSVSTELDQLRLKLSECEKEKEKKIEALKEQLELRKNDITRLQTQLLCDAKQCRTPARGDEVLSSHIGGPTSVQVTITTPSPSFAPISSASCPSLPTSPALPLPTPTSPTLSASASSASPVPTSASSASPVPTPASSTSLLRMPTSTASLLLTPTFSASPLRVATSSASPLHTVTSSASLWPTTAASTVPLPSVSPSWSAVAASTSPSGPVISESVTVSSGLGQVAAAASTFVQQIKELREALRSATLSATPYRNFPTIINKYRRECGRLRHRLTESNNACDLLRVRLEELAEFLEQILDMEERGLIDLSGLTGVSRTALCKSLNDSRALSQTLSQSILSGVESFIEEDISPFDISQEDIDEEPINDMSISFDVRDVSRFSYAVDGSLRTPTIANRPSLSEVLPVFSDIEDRTQKIDNILSQMVVINDDLTNREHKLSCKLDELQLLRATISELEEKLSLASSGNVSTLRSSEIAPLCNKPEVACQTLLAMAPRQSVSSLPDLSTSYLSSDSLSNGKMAPLIEENVKSDDTGTLPEEENLSPRLIPMDASSSNCMLISAANLLSPSSILTGSGEATSSKSSPAKLTSLSSNDTRHAPASPSESEAWSEPDRNVSLARIGLETSGLAATLDRSRSRHSRQSCGVVHSSESDNEELLLPLEAGTPALHGLTHSGCPLSLVGPHCGTLMPGSAVKPSPKRRSDACEVRRLTAKLRTLEHLNETLKAELNIYQSLSLQLSPSSDAQQSDYLPCKPSIPGVVANMDQPDMVSSSDSSSSGSCAGPIAGSKKQRRLFSTADENIVLAAPLLQEIRSLRSKLEESISNNDQLRDQLEAAVLSCSRMHDDPSQLAHITAALLNAQETLQLTRDKLSFAQRCEQVQSDRCSVAERRADGEAKLVSELRAQLKEAQLQLTSAVAQQELCDLKYSKELEEWKNKCQVGEKRLREACAGYEESEVRLQERLTEAVKTCEENEARFKDQKWAASEVSVCVHESAESQWPHSDHLHSALQASETQVLKVSRDRLVLLGEQSKLQSQLLSAQAQTTLLQKSLSEEGQTAVKNLQKRCAHLLSLNTQLTKERMQLLDKLAGYVAVEKLANKSDITLETLNRETSRKNSFEATGDSRLCSLTVQQLQKNHSLLQEDHVQLQKDYSHLQKLYNELQECEKEASFRALSAESAVRRAEEQLQEVCDQYEEKLMLLREDSSTKLCEAERKLQEAEQRFHDRLSGSEHKLQQLQQQYRSKEEYKKLEGRLQEALQQLLAAEKTSIKLRTELQTLKAKQAGLPKLGEGLKRSNNKENISNVIGNQVRVPCPKSPQSATYCMLDSPVEKRRRSHLGTSGVMTSPLRHLRFSDPNLTRHGLVSSSSALSPSLTDLQERPDDDDTSRHSESPDLGLGSSDNGQMSSLERVMGHAPPSQPKHFEHSSLYASYVLSPARDKNASLRGVSSSTSDICSTAQEQPIDVLISDRHSLPPDASGQLCAVQSHTSLASSNETLSKQVRALQGRLQYSDSRLAEALGQLRDANARKQSVERAICRQLTKTHQVLRRAKGNMEARKDSSTSATAPDRHSSLN